ncbi:MAG TPA: hypothetical protein VE621_06345 [Bryobacteraceae bacterium]|jgi:hypothetical protein|nr:hypothetical protein [Bryobacteraceae bacterium]
MKKDELEMQDGSGLFIGSEPLGSDPERRMKDTGDDDGRDKGDDDSTDKGDDDSTDKADTDTTDKGDRGDDSRDTDGKD